MPGRPRNPDIQARNAKVFAMRRAGWPFNDIAAAITREQAEADIAAGRDPRPTFTVAAATHGYRDYIKTLYKSDFTDAIALENERLDDAQRIVASYMRRKYYKVSQATGKLSTGPDGSFLEDIEPNLAAVRQYVAISESRRKLNGYDAPRRQVIEVITEDAIDAQIRALTEELDSAETTADHRVPAREATPAEGPHPA